MIIKITSINDTKLGSFDAKEIVGTRVDDGAEWRKAFFANNQQLASELSDFGIGETINVKMKQEGKFWNIENISEASEALIAKAKESGGGGNPTTKSYGAGKSTGSSDKMSKAEWAEKDRKAKVGYSIHNSLAAAAKLCEVGTNPAEVIEYAKALLPYLMLEEIPGTDNPFVADGDPLDPPA